MEGIVVLGVERLVVESLLRTWYSFEVDARGSFKYDIKPIAPTCGIDK
jgi:hypothetical protein